MALLLLDRGDSVWLGDPGYPGARGAYDLAGAALTPLPMDDAGVGVEVSLRHAPRAGRDLDGRKRGGPRGLVSIHAPRAGRDT